MSGSSASLRRAATATASHSHPSHARGSGARRRTPSRARRALAPEELDRMERIARGFPGRTVTVEPISGNPYRGDVMVRIDGVDAEELFDVYFAQTA